MNNMIEIERWTKDENGELVANPEFVAIFNGERMYRSPLLECSGRYEGCYLYGGKIYENWVNWGYDHIYLLLQEDNYNAHQDREGRVGETYNVDRCQNGSDIINDTV